MSIVELIGFVISFFAMAVLFFRKKIEQKRQAQNPEFYKEMEERRESGLREMLRALDVQYEKDEDERDEEEEDEEDEVDFPIPIKRTDQKEAVKQASYYQKTAKRKVPDKYEYSSKIEQYRLQSKIENRSIQTSIGDSYKNRFDEPVVSLDMENKGEANPYALEKKETENRVARIFGVLESKKDMIIIQEVIGPPKALHEK